MTPEELLCRLQQDLTPSAEAHSRVRSRLERRIESSAALLRVREKLAPTAVQGRKIWDRILARIGVEHELALFTRLCELLTPSRGLTEHLKQRLWPRLVPVQAVAVRQIAFKWVAAFVLVALCAKAGPQLFLAPRTVAESATTLLPTRGEVTISIGGLWQPVEEEIVLESGMVLRTHDGEASILLRDDGVIRMDAFTSLRLNDTSDRTHESAQDVAATVTLFTGRIWVQGLTPSQLRGISVQTEYGTVVVHEGSVSIAEGETVTVNVWDRRAEVATSKEQTYLVAGEWTDLNEDGIIVVKKLPEEGYERPWVDQNLRRDAVHRQSIAQLQQERRAARAGILPTSPLYPVKRIAETVDVLLTFGDEARTQKRVEQVSVRLDEAAVLLAEGEVEAGKVSLVAYRDSLLALATGSGDTLVQALLSQAIAEETSRVVAILPNDTSYIIKQAVLEASASVPDGSVDTVDVRGVILIDTIAALLDAVDEHDAQSIGTIWSDLQAQLSILDDEGALRPEVRREAKVLLSEFAFAVVQAGEAGDGVSPDLVAQVQPYLPPAEDSTLPTLTEDQLAAIVQGIRDRIFVYHMQRSRVNQLVVELNALAGHPDQGSILRRLYYALPDGPEELPLRVRKEIIRLQWQKSAE